MTAPVPRAPQAEEGPRVPITRRAVLVGVFFALTIIGFLYFVVPRLAGLEDTWDRIDEGDPWWLAVALLFEVASFGGYIALFRAVFVRDGSRIHWRESYQITMASLAATRLLATAGAGGIALTAWALRRSGMDAREVADRMVCFIVLLYAVYLLTVLLGGLGLRVGLLPGNAPFAITVVPAIFAGALLLIMVLATLVPTDLERRLGRWANRGGRLARIIQRVANAPAALSKGARIAGTLVGRVRDPMLLGAVAWWYFDILTLWACFNAFGEPPAFAVLCVAYFVGMLGNLLPLPGGIGGVDGGMIGALVAFGVPFGLATVSVLVYRGFSFWLPTVPGAIAYLQLRRTVRDWDG